VPSRERLRRAGEQNVVELSEVSTRRQLNRPPSSGVGNLTAVKAVLTGVAPCHTVFDACACEAVPVWIQAVLTICHHGVTTPEYAPVAAPTRAMCGDLGASV
jgi:hypothetical protein